MFVGEEDELPSPDLVFVSSLVGVMWRSGQRCLNKISRMQLSFSFKHVLEESLVTLRARVHILLWDHVGAVTGAGWSQQHRTIPPTLRMYDSEQEGPVAVDIFLYQMV